MSNMTFFKQWAQYRKQGRLQNPLLALEHRPINVQELSFLLEVATSFSLLHSIPLQSLPSPYKSTLLSNPIDNSLVKSKINQNYIQHLIAMNFHLNQESKKQSHLHQARKILIEVLEKLVKKIKVTENNKNQECHYLLFLGVCLEMQFKTKKVIESLDLITGWWSSKRWLGQYVSQETFHLLVLWGYFEQKNEMQWLQDSAAIVEKLFYTWFKQIQSTLSRQKEISDQTLASIEKQAREICRLWQLKSHKSSHIYIKKIKVSLFESYKRQKEYRLFATLFTVLQIVSLEIEANSFSYTDIIENEELFYSALFHLQRIDCLQFFSKFHSFMRDHSVYPLLKVNSLITSQLQTTKDCQSEIKKDLQNKDLEIMHQFLIKPLEISKNVLQFYLELSGVTIVQAKKKVRRIINSQKMSASDPMLFMLILKNHWQDEFGYQVIGLSLWITLQTYCKELSQRKDITQKELSQYLKKLKLSLCLFLLGLKYPIKMLQYLPQESEIINELVLVPVLPAILLQNGYFFKQFDRDLLKVKPKSELSLQSDSLPWANKVLLYNNIPTILHNHKGLLFYTQALSFVASANLKIYAEIIIKSLTAALQGVGLHQLTNQQDRKQCLSLISSQKIQQMRTLLRKVSKMGEKLGSAALQLLKLLEDAS